MKRTTILFIALIMTIIFTSACGGARKCNGSRGTATDMGTM